MDAHSEYIIELMDIGEATDYFLHGYSKISPSDFNRRGGNTQKLLSTLCN